MTSLLAVNSLAQTLPERAVIDKLFPIVKGLVADLVPNVRFNVALTLRTLADKVGGKKIYGDEISKLLKQLSADSDKDVKFFASH